MPGGFQLGSSGAFFEGVFVGAVWLWALGMLVIWLLGIQIVASLLDRTKRFLVIRWLIRATLLVKSAPTAALSGALLWASTQSEKLQNQASGDWWPIFVMSVIWFAFIPCASITLLSLIWMGKRIFEWLKAKAVGSEVRTATQ
jgi:hypothetical protein